MKFLSLIENNLIIEKKQNYVAIIGSNASKTARSPKLWNYVYKKMNSKIKMYPFDVKSKNLKKLFKYLEKDKYFLGCSIAVPFKEKAFEILKKNIDKSSIGIGSINCIYRDRNFSLKGLNTDGIASLEVFENKFGRIKSKKVGIIGYGGVGKSVSANFLQNNNVFIFSRKKKDNLNCKKLNMKWNNFSDLSKKILDMDIIINCTSIGFNTMKNKSPINLNILKKLNKKTIIYDVIYNPEKTKLLINSEIVKLKTLNGSLMNIYQALISFKYVNNITQKKSIIKIKNLMKSAVK